MPNKHNTKCRHHIAQMEFSVRNWHEYDAALRARGSLTMWITPEAMAVWTAQLRSTPGGQSFYSDLAVQTILMLRLAFRQPLHQTEGLMSSIFELLEVDLKAPDHSAVSRRAMSLKPISEQCVLPTGPAHILIDSTGLKVYGAGEWLQEKHDQKSRRSWRKLHLAVDADTGQIVASILTEQDINDPSQVCSLLNQIEYEISQVMADGAYDGAPTYETIVQRSPPDRSRHTAARHSAAKRAIREQTVHTRHASADNPKPGPTGLAGSNELRQACVGGNHHGPYKAIIGPRLRARHWLGQQTEAAVAVAVLNRMLAAELRPCFSRGGISRCGWGNLGFVCLRATIPRYIIDRPLMGKAIHQSCPTLRKNEQKTANRTC